MSFKFDLRQRVTLPGSVFVQAQVIGRGEDLIYEPQYKLGWTDDGGYRERIFPESIIVFANTEPQPQPEVITAKPGETLAAKMRAAAPAAKRKR